MESRRLVDQIPGCVPAGVFRVVVLIAAHHNDGDAAFRVFKELLRGLERDVLSDLLEQGIVADTAKHTAAGVLLGAGHGVGYINDQRMIAAADGIDHAVLRIAVIQIHICRGKNIIAVTGLLDGGSCLVGKIILTGIVVYVLIEGDIPLGGAVLHDVLHARNIAVEFFALDARGGRDAPVLIAGAAELCTGLRRGDMVDHIVHAAVERLVRVLEQELRHLLAVVVIDRAKLVMGGDLPTKQMGSAGDLGVGCGNIEVLDALCPGRPVGFRIRYRHGLCDDGGIKGRRQAHAGAEAGIDAPDLLGPAVDGAKAIHGQPGERGLPVVDDLLIEQVVSGRVFLAVHHGHVLGEVVAEQLLDLVDKLAAPGIVGQHHVGVAAVKHKDCAPKIPDVDQQLLIELLGRLILRLVLAGRFVVHQPELSGEGVDHTLRTFLRIVVFFGKPALIVVVAGIEQDDLPVGAEFQILALIDRLDLIIRGTAAAEGIEAAGFSGSAVFPALDFLALYKGKLCGVKLLVIRLHLPVARRLVLHGDHLLQRRFLAGTE